MLHGLARDRLEAPLAAWLASGRAVLGTCAGAILLARRVTGPAQRSFAALDVDVERNAYGTQLDSFAATLESGDADSCFAGLRAIFVRAPRLVRVGDRVDVLARVGRDPVLVRSGATWAATFHPELADDDRVLRAWLAVASGAAAARAAAPPRGAPSAGRPCS